jgi:hypothetical protein
MWRSGSRPLEIPGSDSVAQYLLLDEPRKRLGIVEDLWLHEKSGRFKLNAKTIISRLEDETRRSEESSYNHRLPLDAPVAQGMTWSASVFSGSLGDGPGAVDYWRCVHKPRFSPSWTM